MITTKTVKIKKTDNFESKYFEKELSKLGFDVLRWAITAFDGEYYTVNAAVVEE